MKRNKKIYIVGTGMDGLKTITAEGLDCIKNADVIIGAERILNLKHFEILEKPSFKSYKSEDIYKFISDSEYKIFAVLTSGDNGFHSCSKKLMKMLKRNENFEVSLISGISSPVYFCSKIEKYWSEMKFISLHGAENNIIRNIASEKNCFFLLGGNITAGDVCRKICDYGMKDIKVYIGEDLAFENEKIYTGYAKDFVSLSTGKLSVMVTENPHYERFAKIGITDTEFIREKVPMTKAETRAVIISKLCISKGSICWDIGCGTGSVSVEMALQCPDGRVYAVDKNLDAVRLTEMNSKKFLCDNIETMHGSAPECIENLEKPDIVFIGGSSGKTDNILDMVYKKNPFANIVITAVSLETVRDVLKKFESLELTPEITQLNFSRTRKVGSHTMLNSENPVFIISSKGLIK